MKQRKLATNAPREIEREIDRCRLVRSVRQGLAASAAAVKRRSCCAVPIWPLRACAKPAITSYHHYVLLIRDHSGSVVTGTWLGLARTFRLNFNGAWPLALARGTVCGICLRGGE